jgi:hypothetical protein
MSKFDDMVRQATELKVKKDELEKVRRDEAQQKRDADLRADELAMDEVGSILREAAKALAGQGVKAELNLNRNAPTMAKTLVVGHAQSSAAGRRQAILRVERANGRYEINVMSQNGNPKGWDVDSNELRETVEGAFEDALNRWNELAEYR